MPRFGPRHLALITSSQGDAIRNQNKIRPATDLMLQPSTARQGFLDFDRQHRRKAKRNGVAGATKSPKHTAVEKTARKGSQPRPYTTHKWRPQSFSWNVEVVP